jgi:hypothetical protein
MLPERRQSYELHMNTTDDKKSALVRASSASLVRTGSQALARRGLRDLESTEQKTGTPIETLLGLSQDLVEKLAAAGVTTVEALANMTPEQLGAIEGIVPSIVEEISFAVIHYLAKQAQLLFCLDHHCAHNRCPNVMHLDFALVPFTKHSPESLRSLIERGPLAPEYRSEARFLFCLDHQCTHNWCPYVPHVDFALVPLRSIHSEALQRSIKEGPLGWDERSPKFFHALEYWVLQTNAGWKILEDNEVGWEPAPEREPPQDGGMWVKAPDTLRGRLKGPFFTISEAWQYVTERNHGEHNQAVVLPRIVPHVWCSDGCCSFCGESNPTQHCQPCPKRSCDTWYEVLGVSEDADQSRIDDAYRELAKASDRKRLQYRDDIKFECGDYSETEPGWFNAAYAVLRDPARRREYDTELQHKRKGV